MSTIDDDCLHQLQILNAEILKLVAVNPELRRKQLIVRAAHLVAETLDTLMSSTGISVDELAARTTVPPELLSAALSASFDVSTTWETVGLLAEAAGFRFEIQFTASATSRATQPDSESELGKNKVDTILVRFPSPFQTRFAEHSLQSGLQALMLADNNKRSTRRIGSFSRKTPVWEIVGLADDCCFELEFRFAQVRGIEDAVTADVETYYQFGMSPISQCDDEPEAERSSIDTGYRI